MNIPDKYDPQEAEPRIQQFWEKHQIYRFNPEDTKTEIYSIDTPPPTISGKMHMGHAFGNSQQDFIARYKRMCGYNVLQPFGTDDNGLPTQLLIQKLKNVRAKDLPRKEFVQLCLNTLKKELRPKYLQDWKRLGISCDFQISYTTINDHCTKISQNSFLELSKMGRAYRQEAPTIWCPQCCTAIAQIELEDHEKESFFNDILFKVNKKNLLIATTRPELLPACVAVFYHPEDQRYRHLQGKKALVPLFNFEVPILADNRVEPEKGTGIVMCCTFGDKNDVEWQKSYQLPIKTALSKEGKMTSLTGKYTGLSIAEAREKIIVDLKEENLLVKQKKITHSVNVHERCGHETEFIHSKQWFIRYLDLKEDMLKWGEELNWFPPYMKNRYDNWVKGLSWDWCISRQIHFGTPFPVWLCQDCDEIIFAKKEDLPVDPLEDQPPLKFCPKCGSKQIVGESDIINTWATSSLTPTIVKELFKDKPVYNLLIHKPMNLRPQGHDIITFWLFNTVVKSHLHYQMKPWFDCFINGWMLDSQGKKMSKSKGNIIEPQAMIEKYSADALRFMSGGCKLGDDLPFPEKDIVTGQKFINKLWNASKFSLMHLKDYQEQEVTELFDFWLLSKLHQVVKICTDHFEKYEYSKVKAEVENFFWHTFCDQYLEIIKDRLYNPNLRGHDKRRSAQFTLYQALLTILKLMAPFMPHITEEIYQIYFAKKENVKSIHLSSWPKTQEKLINLNIELSGDLGIDLINSVRRYKSVQQMSLKEELKELILTSEDPHFSELIKPLEEDLKAVLKVKEIKYTGETCLESEKFNLKIGIQK